MILTIIIIIILIALMGICFHHMTNDKRWYEMLHTACFRYQTDCYMKGTYPVFEYVTFIKPMPFFGFHWRHMVPKAYYVLLKPYMEELENDPRYRK